MKVVSLKVISHSLHSISRLYNDPTLNTETRIKYTDIHIIDIDLLLCQETVFDKMSMAPKLHLAIVVPNLSSCGPRSTTIITGCLHQPESAKKLS